MAANTTVTPEIIAEIITADLILTITGSFLSIIGAVLLFLAHYFRWKNGIRFDEPRKYLLFLTIADLGIAIGNVWGAFRFIDSKDHSNNGVLACNVDNRPPCVAQSFFTTTFSMSSFFWTTIIAFHLYWTLGEEQHAVVDHGEDSSSRVGRCDRLIEKIRCKRKTLICHVAGWIIPIVITTIAASQGALGSDLSVGSGAWCWISACLPDIERTLWMTFTGKGWEILMYFSCMAFYILFKYRQFRIRRQREREESCRVTRYGSIQQELSTRTNDDLIFLFLWLIEVALRMSGTIRYFFAAVRRHTSNTLPDYDTADNILLHIQSFGDCAQAFCSFVLFCI